MNNNYPITYILDPKREKDLYDIYIDCFGKYICTQDLIQNIFSNVYIKDKKIRNNECKYESDLINNYKLTPTYFIPTKYIFCVSVILPLEFMIKVPKLINTIYTFNPNKKEKIISFLNDTNFTFLFGSIKTEKIILNENIDINTFFSKGDINTNLNIYIIGEETNQKIEKIKEKYDNQIFCFTDIYNSRQYILPISFMITLEEKKEMDNIFTIDVKIEI